MKIAVTGYKGRIGSRLIALGAVPLVSDVTDLDAVRRELEISQPDVVVHAASISSIAECETNLDKAILVNLRGTNHICQAMWEVKKSRKVVLLSTEQVFDGKKGNYSEEDEPFPINDYGRTKFGAEVVAKNLYGCKVIRLSRGVSAEIGKDIHKYLFKLRGGEEIHVPDFLVRSYSHLDFLAYAIWDYAIDFDAMPEMLHIGGASSVSFYQFMLTISSKFGLDHSLVRPRSTEIPDHPRPFNCGFNVSRAQSLGIPIYSLNATVEKLKEEYERLQSLNRNPNLQQV